MGGRKPKKRQTCNKRNKKANKAEIRFFLIGNGGKAVQEMCVCVCVGFVFVLFFILEEGRQPVKPLNSTDSAPEITRTEFAASRIKIRIKITLSIPK